MNTSIATIGSVKKIRIDVEKFDVGNMKDIKRSIEREITNRTNNIVLDFSHVKFIDSSGLSVIIATFKKLKSMRGTLRLCGLQSQPLSLLKITQLHKILSIVDNCNKIR